MSPSQRSAAFNVPTLPSRRARTSLPCIRTPVCRTNEASAHSRRKFLRDVACVGVASVGLLPLIPSPSCAGDNLTSLEKNVVPVVMCRKIMSPVQRYIEEGAWDKGRTNVNYCTRVLALRRRMKDAAEQLEGDDFYDAMGIMDDMSNTMTQLDATLYTPLFIPADEGISVEQRKYQQQAFGFYNDAVQFLDSFLSKVPGNALENAKQAAARAKYEIYLGAE